MTISYINFIQMLESNGVTFPPIIWGNFPGFLFTASNCIKYYITKYSIMNVYNFKSYLNLMSIYYCLLFYYIVNCIL